MRLNATTVLIGGKVRLEPYKKEHVSRYHGWMQDDELLAQTASEKLTLDEEFENCESWRNDETKLTFLIFVKDKMIGDVNAFFKDEEAEVEIMIAEMTYRRNGYAEEALRIFMAYLHQRKRPQRFVAKIGQQNSPSIALFEKLGFRFVQKVDAFQEVEYDLLQAPSYHYAECTDDDSAPGGILAQEFQVATTDTVIDVTLLYYGRKTVLVLCGDSLRAFALAGPAKYGNDIAATCLCGDSHIAAGMARRLSAKTNRLIFVSFGSDDDDDDDVALEAALSRRIPPSTWLPHPATISFDSLDSFSDFTDLRNALDGGSLGVVEADEASS